MVVTLLLLTASPGTLMIPISLSLPVKMGKCSPVVIVVGRGSRFDNSHLLCLLILRVCLAMFGLGIHTLASAWMPFRLRVPTLIFSGLLTFQPLFLAQRLTLPYVFCFVVLALSFACLVLILHAS
jgi:hypothetical protein